MLLRRPKNHTLIDMYKAWCNMRQAVAANPGYYTAYDYKMRMARYLHHI